MTAVGGIPGLAAVAQAPAKADPGKLGKAAGQFEALLLSAMLKSASSESWMGSSEDQSGASLSEMAQEQFAQALADSGGLGIAKMITGAVQPKIRSSLPASTPGTPASH